MGHLASIKSLPYYIKKKTIDSRIVMYHFLLSPLYTQSARFTQHTQKLTLLIVTSRAGGDKFNVCLEIFRAKFVKHLNDHSATHSKHNSNLLTE